MYLQKINELMCVCMCLWFEIGMQRSVDKLYLKQV